MDTNQAKSSARILDISFLESEISKIGGPNEYAEFGWIEPLVHEQVSSTNDVVIENFAKVQPGKAIVVIANEQTKGRGRLDRTWSTPVGSGIAMSIGIHTDDIAIELSALPLFSGVAVIRALQEFKVPAELKWPNDIIFTQPEMRKLGGILVQLIQNKLIIGIGLNVDLTQEELPVLTATSLAIENYKVDRHELIIQVLEEFRKLKSENNQWLEEYKKFCATLGKNVLVSNNDGTQLSGEAISIEPTGALVIKNLENLYQITFGDIEHLRVTSD